MRKTNTKTTIFLFLLLLGALSRSSSVFASEINVKNIITLVNEERTRKGLEPLKENQQLSKIAQDKAEDMIAKDYFAHTSPEGVTPWFWFKKENYDYEYAGENLAINFSTAEKQNDAWMESPTHRKNILNSNFDEIGVYVISGNVGGKETTVAVQEFGSLTKRAVVEQKNADSGEVYGTKDIVGVEIGDGLDENFANIASSGSNTAMYLRIAKGCASLSAIVFLFMLFAVFTHKLSGIGKSFQGICKKMQEYVDFHKDYHEQGHRIAVKFFPMDMKKVEITHLHHMKQKE